MADPIFWTLKAYPERNFTTGRHEDRIDPTLVWNPAVFIPGYNETADNYTRPDPPTPPEYPLDEKLPEISGLWVGAYCKDNLGSYTCPCHTGFIADDWFESGVVVDYNNKARDPRTVRSMAISQVLRSIRIPLIEPFGPNGIWGSLAKLNITMN